jgi:hypothetical protein
VSEKYSIYEIRRINVMQYQFRKPVKDEKKAKTPVTLPDLSEERPVAISDDDVPEEVKVAIIAAISAYYDSQPVQNNEFVVRKIKRLR